jgi:hypothetical protein
MQHIALLMVAMIAPSASPTAHILHAAALVEHRCERVGARAQKRGRERRRLQQRLHAQQHALARVAVDRALAARMLAQLRGQRGCRMQRE